MASSNFSILEVSIRPIIRSMYPNKIQKVIGSTCQLDRKDTKLQLLGNKFFYGMN